MIRSHPSNNDLFAYAESLESGKGPVAAHVARHISECAPCRAEVKAMADSLHYVDDAERLEPSKRLTASLLLAAKAERLGTSSTFDSAEFQPRLAWGAMTVAVVGLAAVLSYALQDATVTTELAGPISMPDEIQHLNAAVLPFNLTTSPTPKADILTKATEALSQAPKSRWEKEQHRKIRMLSEHIAAGLERLDKNPANVRAKEVVESSGPLLLETLTTYYAERSL